MKAVRHINEVKHAKILAFLESYIAEHGVAPLKGEICEAVGLTYQPVSNHLKDMEELGYITVGHGYRNITVNMRRKPKKKAAPDPHTLVLEEAQRRLAKLMPGLPPDVLGVISEQVARAVERNGLSFD